MRQRVSPGPLDPTPAYMFPEVSQVRDLSDGTEHASQTFIASFPYDDGVRLRSMLRQNVRNGEPRIVCAICSKPVYSRSTKLGEFYFWHASVDGSCPQMDIHRLSPETIKAMKYKGAQESEPHRRMKRMLERSLVADPSFSNILVEKTWHSTRDPDDLRRPDVSAWRGDLRIAFEAQLSTTSLGIVVERRAFYATESALLVWFLPTFDPDFRRLTHDDILFNNNSNIFVIDDETEAASIEARKFTVRCHYLEPIARNSSLEVVWRSRLVTWDELTCDANRQVCFFFDYAERHAALAEVQREAAEAEKNAAKAAALEWERKRKADADVRLRALAMAMFTDLMWRAEPPYENFSQAWTDLQEALGRRGIVFDPANSKNYNLLHLIVRALASAKAGGSVGFDPNFHLVRIAHTLADNAPDAVPMFERVLTYFGHSETFVAQDKSGKWRKKRAYLVQPPLPPYLYAAAAFILQLPQECMAPADRRQSTAT